VKVNVGQQGRIKLISVLMLKFNVGKQGRIKLKHLRTVVEWGALVMVEQYAL